MDVFAEFDETDSRFVVMATKLLVPAPRGQWVPRPQLVQVLASGLSAKMTLVCAPTGWGKTSVLAEWARSSPDVGFAWVSLDAGDDETMRFWRYVVAAIAAVEPSLAATAQRRLRGPVVSISDEILPVLVNDLGGMLRPLVLVLDDVHVITRPEIIEQLGYLVDRLPRAVHLAVAAQSDPAMRLGRLRAMGDLAELRGAQLRFTDEEAAMLLNRVHGLGLAPDEVSRIQRQTEGWVAGLNLTALSLKRAEDRGRMLDELPADERFLVDYLWNEVVLDQPRAVRHFLMRTAILDRLTGPSCDAVAQVEDSGEMLRELEHANLFVIPLDSGRKWFRYHHLFRALLLRQLERYAPGLIPDLHRRASTWYAESGLMGEAIDHAITAGDVHYAADELERHWLEFYSAGQETIVLESIDRLPAEALEMHPVLALVRAGIARAMGRLDEVEAWLGRAEEMAGDAPARGFASSMAGGVALGRSMYRLALGDPAGAVAWARRAMDLEPVQGSREHVMACYFLGVATFYEDPDLAEPLLRTYLATIPPGEEDVRRFFAIALVAEVHVLRGELGLAEGLAREALEVAHANELDEYPSAEQAHVALGAVLLVRGELDGAEEQFERAAALARRGGDRVEYAHALVWLARARARQGDSIGARAALDAARRLVPKLGDPVLAPLVHALELEPGMHTPPGAGGRPGGERSHEPSLPPSPLTGAEMIVLRLLPGDLTYREMALHLYLSLNTVRTHARHVRRKLGVSTRVEAVARARKLGLL